MTELIIALDLPNEKKAVALARSLKGLVSWFKVGLELFVASGPRIVEDLKVLGFKVFLDLKFYDIPNTVFSGVRSACQLEVDILTIHCQGGQRMCEAALAAANDGAKSPLIFGVTALTSFAEGEMPGISQSPEAYAFELAGKAASWGLAGIVCSGLEVQNIKKSYPELLCLCPGIRPFASHTTDQRRVVTPMEAVRRGADYMVVGRPITQAPDPQKVVETINGQIQSAL